MSETEIGTPQASREILVVDDDAGVRFVVQWALEEQGFKVKTAADGREAIQKLDEGRPDLLVLDLTMPVLGGSRVADHLRQQFDEVPILLVTADGHAPTKAASVGAYDYLTKPFEVEDLVGAVQRGFAI